MTYGIPGGVILNAVLTVGVVESEMPGVGQIEDSETYSENGWVGWSEGEVV